MTISMRVRNAATRVLLKVPAATDHDDALRDQVIADAHHLLDLADEIEIMEDRLRTPSWRERRAGRLDRRLRRRVHALLMRMVRQSAVV